MDNTTLFTAKELLMGSDPSYVLTPLTLLDLSTFVTNVVIHERIYHLESRTFSSSRFNELLGEEVFTSVPVRSSSSLEDAIVRVWYETTQHIQKLRYGAEARGPVAEEYRTLQQGWSRLLDQEVSTDLLFDPNEHEHWSSDEQDMLSKVVNITHHRGVDAMGLPSDRVRRIVSESNLRGDFSERVAMILGCPYSAGTTREPLLRLRYEQSGRLAPQLSIKAIEDEYRKYVRAYVTDPMPIPLFLTAVLSKTDSLNGFFSELANLRKSARAFRAHRAGMDEAAEKGNIELYTDLRQAIASKAEFWQTLLEACPIVASGAAVVAALSTTGTVPLFASTVAAAMSVLRAMSESSRKRIARRLLKPHFWFVSELSTSASGLTDLTAKVGALWTLRPAQVQHLARGLKRLATLDPSL
jgi:hypothetical protein